VLFKHDLKDFILKMNMYHEIISINIAFYKSNLKYKNNTVKIPLLSFPTFQDTFLKL